MNHDALTSGVISMRELTPMAQSLWAKKSQSGQLSWLPLAIHILDSAQVARLLWRDWVP